MAHQIEQMAYVGATPWHGLGNQLTQKQPLEIWQREAGMDWQILESPVHFKSDAIGHLGTIHSFPEQKVLFRSDTKAPLSVVSQRYHTVQPREVLEFYRDLTEVSGYELETAGVLKGGRKFTALARTGQGAALRVTTRSTATYCWPPPRWHPGYHRHANHRAGGMQQHPDHRPRRHQSRDQVPHNTRFDPQAVKKQLGIAVSQWDDFMCRTRALAGA